MAMPLQNLVESLSRTYTGYAFLLTFVSGLLTIMVERYLYRRRGYRREAAVTAFFGWTYVIGGSLLYLLLFMLRLWV